MRFNVSGKTALVTGGGSGTGRATALALGKAGANVVIGNRNVERVTRRWWLERQLEVFKARSVQ